MSKEASFFEPNSQETIRQQVQAAIQNPMSSLDYLGDYWSGVHKPPANAVVLPNLTVETAEAFYSLVRSELANTEKDMQFSHWLQESLHPSSEEQTTFEHELEHIRSADLLGVDLHKSRLELFFLLDGFGLQLTHSFYPPEDIDPMVKLQIALAPERPSGGDIAVVQEILRENQGLFNNSPSIREMGALILKKTGKNVDELTKINHEL